jgi:hypothetical protein
MATFTVVITNRAERIILHAAGKMTVGVDASPMVMQYRDFAHALTGAPKLIGIAEQNAGAIAELRPMSVGPDSEGKKMPLSEWIETARKTKTPRRGQQRAVAVPIPHSQDELVAVLAQQQAEAVPAEVPAAVHSDATPEPVPAAE